MSLSKQQYEGFAKFFEKPTREGLRDVIKENIGETDYLDFKREWPNYRSLAKHILALSNTGEGALIIGVEQDDEGTIRAVGINKIIDKEEITKGIKAYLPDDIIYDILDFSYKDSEYPEIKGKKFQVLLVEYEPIYIPFLAKKAGEGIKDNAVYVRRGTTSDEATHEELQKIINERLETGYSSKHILDLSEHLGQLKTLYREKGSSRATLASKFLNLVEGDTFQDYQTFLSQLIKMKKKAIAEELELM